jgi:ribosomal protein S18 acetylase RimI-like enzyme
MPVVERERVLIRKLREHDLPALEWEGRYQHFRRLYRHALAEARRGRRVLLVAELAGQIVGQIFVQLDSRRAELADGRHAGYLYAFRVRPDFRNQGIGTQLLLEAESSLRGRGFRRAVIAVARDNLAAQRLYEAMGYHRFAEDPGEWSYLDHEGRMRSVSEPAYMLEKPL